MTTSTDICNEAIALIGGNQPPITGVAPNFDSSAAGQVAAKVYASAVATVANQFGWDFARSSVPLTTTGNTPPFPWTYEYGYPAGCVEIWQLTPPSLADANNPLPVDWTVGINIVGGAQVRVVWSSLASARAVFNCNPAEGTWTALFRQAVVRLLASEFALGVAGKPDLSQTHLESAGAFEKLGEMRGEA